ncbi:MAG: Dna2/Cas4 domain-containing protein [Gemmatimonadaceae bacterium]|nr:Dna2/Cas4 domain-containing protein [Gemmatimonadaceae bacterium]
MTTAVLLALAALALAVLSLALRRRARLPGRVVASDVGGAPPVRLLRSAHYGLSGKPDYLLEERGRIVPVEVKPTRRATRPWLRDVVQLAAYCLLLSESEPRFAGYGYLRYAHHTFRIDFTASLRDELLRTLAALRADLTAADVDPNHHDPRRCARCALVTVCGKVVTGAS